MLTFGLEIVYLNMAMYNKLESIHDTSVKSFIGLKKISPVRSLCSYFMSKYLLPANCSKCKLSGGLLDMGVFSALLAMLLIRFLCNDCDISYL